MKIKEEEQKAALQKQLEEKDNLLRQTIDEQERQRI